MTFDLEKILQSKREYRRHLASRPIAEKLAILDALRARTLSIRGAATSSSAEHTVLQEAATPYRSRTRQ